MKAPSDDQATLYLLPNLMTAGNLFCGFSAVLRTFQASLQAGLDVYTNAKYHEAIAFILGACVFDLLDGRVARLGGQESAFGKEFDSLADLVSFGLAPALLMYNIVLSDFSRTGWLLAFFYLLCGALRLARFNCVNGCHAASGVTNSNSSSSGTSSIHPGSLTVDTEDPHKDFQGFPIPAAAGLIASLTLLMLSMDNRQQAMGNWKLILPPLLLFLSVLMFSRVRYPSFKSLSWKTQRSIPRFIGLIILLGFSALFYEWMPACLFLGYLFYGLIRCCWGKWIRMGGKSKK